MAIGQGIVDFVIPFEEFPVYLKALEKGKHPFAASWEMHGHSPWVGAGGPMDYRKIRRDEVIPAFANASCNTPLHSGFRIVAKAAGFGEKTLTIKPGSLKSPFAVNGSFPPDLAGKRLVLGPSVKNPDVFTIVANTPTELTVREGDLAQYVPPLTGWDIYLLKREIAKKEGKSREPTAQEKQAKALAKKRTFLISDGYPRGCWNAHFAWSTRNQNFDPNSADDDMVDTPKRLAITIRLTDHRRWPLKTDTATADVTPRRARRFKPKPGEKVHWENWDCSEPVSPKKIAEGDVTADEHGLVTVPDFIIGKKGWGNRLVLIRK